MARVGHADPAVRGPIAFVIAADGLTDTITIFAGHRSHRPVILDHAARRRSTDDDFDQHRVEDHLRHRGAGGEQRLGRVNRSCRTDRTPILIGTSPNSGGTAYIPEPVTTITGTSSAEELTGTDIADTITGDQGNDSLYGNEGNDSLSGGAATAPCRMVEQVMTRCWATMAMTASMAGQAMTC